jgi:quercetin dioxygenase-like cupin family protein
MGRLYADPNGESHFSDEEMELEAVNCAPPTLPVNISVFTLAKHFVVLSVPAGWFGDWHPTPHRQFFLDLVGEFEVRVTDGKTRHLRPGSFLFVEDTTGKGHTTRNIGDDAILAVVQLAGP